MRKQGPPGRAPGGGSPSRASWTPLRHRTGWELQPPGSGVRREQRVADDASTAAVPPLGRPRLRNADGGRGHGGSEVEVGSDGVQKAETAGKLAAEIRRHQRHKAFLI